MTSYPDPTSKLMALELTQEIVASIEDAEFLVPNLITAGAITVWIGFPSTGKTALASEVARRLHASGKQVLYLNMDCAPADAKFQAEMAGHDGYTIITPHFFGSQGIRDALSALTEMADSGGDLSQHVFVVDTLKKLADLMNKASVKEVMGRFRLLTALGATILILGHANKGRDANQRPVYEGVNDVETECDNLIYLDSIRNGDVQTIETTPSNKVRGLFHPTSWEYNRKTRVISPVEHLDVTTIAVGRERECSEKSYIDAVIGALSNGELHQGHLVDVLKVEGMGRNKALGLLNRYSSVDEGYTQFWSRRKGESHNTWIYSLMK